ncbi:MAG: cyclic nucleotide-binding domain-containing protein [Acidobacteria bacterium]|nr:cyclic nucleotide-binding domain-containing protein [Acidobacteriota bacterium]
MTGTDDRLTMKHLKTPELEQGAVDFFEKVQTAFVAGKRSVSLDYAGVKFTLRLPAIGEGDRGLVYLLRKHSLDLPGADTRCCVKFAKQQALSRQRLLEEFPNTEFYLSENITVPRILYLDPLGRFSVKEYIEGETLTSLYLRFERLTVKTQRLLLDGIEAYLERLLALFRKRPDCKVSISPNNILVLSDKGRFTDPPRLVLIDPGPDRKKKYEGIGFDQYWNVILPDRIRKYQRTGYLQWMVPLAVTQSDRDHLRGFDIFNDLTPEETQLIISIARVVEFDSEETILRKGAVGENFFLLLEGEVEVRKSHFNRPGALKVRCGQGTVLGEQAFLLRVPRSMNVVAIRPCKLLEIECEAFNGLMRANQIAPYKILRNIAVILAERLYYSNNAYQMLLESQADIL